jgi:hypothetical protein
MESLLLIPRPLRLPAVLAAALLLVGAAASSAQVVATGHERSISAGGGPNARVYAPAVDFSTGEALLVWEGGRDGIERQRVGTDGVERGDPIALAGNDLPDEVPFIGPVTLQRDPSVVALPGNRLVSVWVEELQQLNVDVFYQESRVISSRIVARRFNPGGEPVGPLHEVGDPSLGLESGPEAVRLSNGRLAVVWQVLEGDLPLGVYGRILSVRGIPRSPVLRLDDSAMPGSRPALAAGPDGGFVIAWQACCDSDRDGVFVRSFDAEGEPLGAGSPVNTVADELQIWPAIARGDHGGYLVAWMSPGAVESGLAYQVFGRVLDTGGTPIGTQTALSQSPASAHGAPTLVAALDGYLLAWTSWQGNSIYAVHASTVSEQGTPRGAAVRLSCLPVSTQWELSLAADGEGGYLAAWQGFDVDGNPAINIRPLVLTKSSGRSANLAPARD